jgi:hypothetical protein
MAEVGYFRLGYDNGVPTATITSSGAATGFPVANVADQNRNTRYKPNSTSATHWVKFVFPVAKAIDLLVLLNHDWKAAGVTHVYLKCGTTDDGATWDILALNDWNPTAESSDFDIFFVVTQYTKANWLLVYDVAGTAPLLGEVFIGRVTDFAGSWGFSRTVDHGVDVIDGGGGYDSAEQYGVEREIIQFRTVEALDEEIVALKAVEATLINGLNPCVLLDRDTELTKGLAKYGRLLGPLTWTPFFLNNNSFERTWRQVL